MDPEGIRWSVVTHEHIDRSVDWYWTFGILAVVGIGVSIYILNILLAVILSVGLFAIVTLTIRGPREHEVHVGSKGVNIDGTLYRYGALRSFWVSVEESESDELELKPRARLFLTTTGYIHPRIMLPLAHAEHAEVVRAYLQERLAEAEQAPHPAEHLAELAGF